MRSKVITLGIVFVLVFLLCGSAPSAAAAVNLDIRPVVIDHKAMPSYIVEDTITVRNDEERRKVDVFVFVNNVLPEQGKQEWVHYQQSEKERSLANWIEIQRGFELEPGAEKTLDVRIDIHPNAIPGVYHAAITFVAASNVAEASRFVEGSPQVLVNLEIGEDVQERLQLLRFVPDKRVFTTYPVTFSYEVENIGNRAQVPGGTIRIYDRRGAEVASVAANEGGAELAPENARQLASAWNGGGQMLGRYKALLNVEYGKNGTAVLQDTVFFWVLPWPWLIGIIVTFVLLAVMLGLTIHRRYERHYAHLHRQLQAAQAGNSQRDAGGRRVLRPVAPSAPSHNAVRSQNTTSQDTHRAQDTHGAQGMSDIRRAPKK